jgi:hypothetical protein
MQYYLFAAHFADGTSIIQTEEDKSETTPGRNCFYDVLERQKTIPLISFAVFNDENVFAVDLRDGHFEVNQTPFFQFRHDLETLANFRIIYYRNNYIQSFSDGSSAHFIGYTIGWQANDSKGRNVERIIKI